MNKSETIKTLAKKYTEIFQEHHGFNYNSPSDQYMINLLIEFAGAIEHHLSSEQAVEAEADPRCKITHKIYPKDGFKYCPICGVKFRTA